MEDIFKDYIKLEIIKEYKNFCNDLNLKTNKSSKIKFLNFYCEHYRIFYEKTFTDLEIINIKNILKEV